MYIIMLFYCSFILLYDLLNILLIIYIYDYVLLLMF